MSKSLIALEQAYKNAIMVGKFPSCVLNITAPLNSVDVNVHPAKTEVRFENEKRIFDAVYYATKAAIEEKDRPNKIDLAKAALKQENNPFREETRKTYEQVKLPEKNPNFFATELPRKQEPVLYQRKSEVHKPAPVVSKPEAPEVDYKVIGEAFDTYIFVEQEGKILLIDKHAAHERMLFEKLKAESKDKFSQVLLSPVTVTLSKEEYSAILSNLDVLTDAGFDIDDFGSGTVVVRELPVMLIDDDVKALVEEMAGYLLSSQAPVPEKLDWIYHNTACRAAIKGGDKTNQYELDSFVKKLLLNPDIRYCPHGRPVLIEMTRSDLEKQFGRTL